MVSLLVGLQPFKVLDDWTEILDNGGQVDVLYMDFMKASYQELFF